MRLRMKIVIGILIPLILSVVSIGSLSIHVYRDILYQQLEKNSIQLNRSYARELDNRLKFLLSMVEKIAASVSSSENAEDVFRQDKKINPVFKSYYYTNRNGDILAHYPRHPNLKKNNFPTVKFWNKIVATNQPVISEPDSNLGYNSIFIGAPVTAAYGLQKTSKDKRLVYVSISLDELFKTIADTRISEKRDIFVVSQSGQFLTSGKAEWVMPRKFSQIGNDKTFKDIETHMVSLIAGSGYYTVDHQRYFISFMPVPSARWSLAINILESELINDISRLTQFIRLSLVGIIVILILLTYMTINSITTPVLHLTESMKKVEKGNLNIISTIESNDEIGMLASVFNRMINHIKGLVENLTKEIKEIKYSEEKYRNIFNNTTEGIFQSSPAGRFVTVNPAFAAIFGYDSPEEMIHSITDISKQLYVNPNDREAFEKLIGKDKRVVNFKGRAYKKNGDIIQLSANAHVVQNDKGEIMRYEGVIKDITKKVQAEKLELEKETAAASKQAKSEFLTAMSYEIKTPLNAIKGMTELILDTELSAKQRKRLEIIRSAAFSLSELVNDILDFSRIESGKLSLKRVPFQLREILDELCDIFQKEAAEKNIELIVAIAEHTPGLLIGDPLRLRQIMFNLISNAVKFTDQGEIYIRIACLEQRPDWAKLAFYIKDTGIGISRSESEKIFDSFIQAGRTSSSKHRGVGLGLAISRQLVELMNGTIQVEGRLGFGSIFQFTAEFDKQEKSEPVPEINPKLSMLRALIVDDNTVNRMIMSETLKSFGIRTETARSGQEAIEYIKNNVFSKKMMFSFILIDNRMPGISGIETCRIIKNDLKLSDLPILLMEMSGMEEESIDAKKSGLINDFIVKPIKQKILLKTLLQISGFENE